MTTNPNKENSFLIKTLVTYTKLNAQGTEVKHKDSVVFTLDVAAAEKPWYVLRNYLVPKYLTKAYGPFEVAWQRIYEIKILKLINRENPLDITHIPLRVMTLDQLDNYCRRWDLNVPIYEFYSVEKAREMVALRQEDEKGYEKHLADYREGKQRAYPELDGMRGDKDAETVSDEEFEKVDKVASVANLTKLDNLDKKAADLKKTPSNSGPTPSEKGGKPSSGNGGPKEKKVAENPFAGI